MSRRVLAIRPAKGTFGFALLEDPKNLLDWGVERGQPLSLSAAIDKIVTLIADNEPNILVIEKLKDGRNRTTWETELFTASFKLGRETGLNVRMISSSAARRKFYRLAPITQVQIAERMAAGFADFESSREQKHPEQIDREYRHIAFGAVALALAACIH